MNEMQSWLPNDPAAAVFAANPAIADDPEALSNAAGNAHEAFARLMLRYQRNLAKRIAIGAKTRELTATYLDLGLFGLKWSSSEFCEVIGWTTWA